MFRITGNIGRYKDKLQINALKNENNKIILKHRQTFRTQISLSSDDNECTYYNQILFILYWYTHYRFSVMSVPVKKLIEQIASYV
jgi:hypothetical protein